MADFNSYYRPQVQSLEREYEDIRNKPIEPMYSPEQAAARKREIEWQMQMGGLGMMTGDKALGGFAAPLLAKAMEAQKTRVTDHGEFDPVAGSFKYFPQVRQQLDMERIGKRLDVARNAEAMAQQRWDDNRQRALEYQQTRAMIAAMAQGAGGDKGSISWVGTDDKGGAIYNHSKHGLVVRGPEGWMPHEGRAPGPKQNEPSETAKAAYMKNRGALEQVNIALHAGTNNPDALGSINYLPGAVSQYVPTKGGSGGVNVRALVGDIGSLKVHERSGAAVPAAELPRLKPFVPDLFADSPETILKKLANFKMHYEIIASQLEQGYPLSRFMEEQGKTYVTPIKGITPPNYAGPPGGAPPGGAPPGGMPPGGAPPGAPAGGLSAAEQAELEQRRNAARQGPR